YNWGPGNVDKMVGQNGSFDLSKTPLETQKYVAAINTQAAQYAQAVQTTAMTAQASADTFTGQFPAGITNILDGLKQGGSSITDWLSSLFNSGGADASAAGFAVGGHVRGPGSGTSDSIPAWLSNGEYVVNAGAT